MIHGHHGYLKEALRLNRMLGVFFILHAGVGVWAPWIQNGLPLDTAVLAVGLVAIIAFFFLANEVSLKLLKRCPEADTLALEKAGLFIPFTVFVFSGLLYGLTGQWGVLLLTMIPVLEAQLFGPTRLAPWLFGATLCLFLGALPFGLPREIPIHGFPQALRAFIEVFPFFLALFKVGSIVSVTVRSTSQHVVRLQSLATTDGLTGLINRRQFNHRLHTEMARARRHQAPLSLALFDIDNFKKLNDFYGHPTGDRILKELGSLISNNVRESDIPARYGGEEFALILPETRQVEAHEILERLRLLVERTVFCLPDNPITLTISVGVAQLDPVNHTSFDLVEQADAALYEAKNQGKNRVVYGVVPIPKINVPPPKNFFP